jgi:hypothetical protein
MKQIKWGFLLLAILATVSTMGIGVAISEKNILGAFVAVVLLISCMGYGFTLKKKMRENGEL